MNPYQQRIKEVISLYNSDPTSFSDKELDELQEISDQAGIKFSPIRSEANMSGIFKQAVSGFVSGLTTLPVGEKPRNTYEAISHSLGHLVGFAPAIMAGPLGLASKGATKLASKGVMGMAKVASGLDKGVKGAQVLDKIAVPMVASRFGKKALEKGIARAGLEAHDFMKVGAKTRGILEEAVGLGTASAVSTVWEGPDDMMHGFVGGAIAGGAFGGIGNFLSISNRLKMGNAQQRKTAEKTLKGLVGATVTGLPAHLRDEPIEMVMYETLLGGFFGYNARPAHEAEGGKFIQRSLYGTEKGRVFNPEGSKAWNSLAPKAQEYVTKQSTDYAKDWLYGNFDAKWVNDIVQTDVVNRSKDVTKIPETSIAGTYRKLAHELYLGQNPSKEVYKPINPEALVEDGIYREDADHSVIHTDIIGMMNSIGRAVQTSSVTNKISPNQIATDINQRMKRSSNADEFIKSMESSSIGKEVTKKMEKRFRQFYHNRSKAPEKVYTVEIGEHGAELKLQHSNKNGKWKGKNVGMSMVDMPVTYTDPNGTYSAITHIEINRPYKVKNKDGTYRTVDNKEIVAPFENGMELVDGQLISKQKISPKEYYEMDLALDAKNRYSVSGKKDNKELWTKEYNHKSQSPAKLIDMMAEKGTKEHAELTKSLKDSREMMYEWYGLEKGDNRRAKAQEMHDKAWSSNVITMAEKNNIPSTDLSRLISKDFSKNVVDYNKRTQLEHDMSIKQDATAYRNELPDGRLRYVILKDIDGSSATDGSVILRKKAFDRGVDYMGLPKDAGMLKAVYADKTPDGVIQVKNATRRANDKWEKFLADNDVDAVFFESAVKNKGSKKSYEYSYDKKSGEIKAGNYEVFDMPVEGFRINPSTFESNKVGWTGVPRQMASVLNEAQTPQAAKLFFEKIIEPSLKGEKDYTLKYDTEAKVLEALNKDSQFIFKMPLKDIHKQLEYDTPLARKIRKSITKLDEEGHFFEYGDSDFQSFHQRNARLLKVADASYGASNYDKYGYKYFEGAYKRFVISRYMQPKWKASSKSVLIPNTPDGKSPKQGEIYLDNGQRKMPVEVEGRKDIKTLGQLFDKAQTDKTLDLDLTVVRVPADSVSGIRVLKLKGFTGERGFGSLTNPKDDVYLGGADKDIDSVFLFHGFDKGLKNHYNGKNGKNKSEWDGVEAKSHTDKFLVGGEQKDGPFTKSASKFSPSMRKMVAASAVRGKEGLGFGLTQKNVISEWADIIHANGGSMVLKIQRKPKGKKPYTEYLELKMKEGGRAKLREIGRDVVNFSADSADYPNMISPPEYRKILFDSVFQGTVRTGKKSREATFADMKASELGGELANLISIINPRGRNYTTGESHSLHDIGTFLKNYRGSGNGIHHHIAQRMKADGLDKQFADKVNLIEKGRIDEPISPRDQKLTGIKRIDWAKAKHLKVKEGDPVDKQRDFAHKNIYSKTGLKVIADRSLDLANELVDVLPKNSIRKYLYNIREHAIDIRNKSLINKGADFDTLVRNTKEQISAELMLMGKKPKTAHELLDMWLLSNFNKINPKGEIVNDWKGYRKDNGEITTDRSWMSKLKKGKIKGQKYDKNQDNWESSQQVHVEPYESSAISDSAIRKMQKGLNDYVAPKELPKVEVKPEPEPVKVEIPTLRGKIDRMAVTENDLVQTRELQTNLNENPQWKKNFRDLFTEWTMKTENVPRDETTISMRDIYALNNHFKNLRKYPDSPELQKSVWYNDLTTVDKKMQKFDQRVFAQYQTTVLTKDGPVKRTVKRSFSTLGSMRNWFHKGFLHQDAVLEVVDSKNDNLFKFRKDLNIKDAEMINDFVFKIKDARNQGTDVNAFKASKLYRDNVNKKFKVGEKEYTLDQIIDKVDKDYTAEFERFGKKYIWDKKPVDKAWYNKFQDYVKRGYYQQFVRDLQKSKSPSEIAEINSKVREVYIDKLSKEYPQLGKVKVDKDGSTVLVENMALLKKLEPTMERLMVGNHGIYMEFNTPANKGKFVKKRLQYNEYDRNGVKLYDQFKTVNYADYKKGKWYADINEYGLSKSKITKDKEYLKYDPDGKLDIEYFIKTAVRPMEQGKDMPPIPLETLLKYHYEVNMEKQLKNPSKKEREKFRSNSKTAFKGINQRDFANYFPKRYGHSKESRKQIDEYIASEVKKAYEQEYQRTGSKEKAEAYSELRKAQLQNISENSIGETANVESSVLDQLASRIDYKKLTAEEIAKDLGSVGKNSRPDSSLDRTLDLPFGFDTSTKVIDRYKKQVIRSHYKLLGAAMANHRIDNMVKRKAFETDINGNKVKYTKEQLVKLKEDGYNNNTEVWADYLRMYVRDVFGHQTTFPQRIIDSMGKNDSLKLKKNFYYLTSDQAIINGVEKLNAKFLEKTGRNLPFLRNMPKGNSPAIKEQRLEKYSRMLHKMGGLEARYQLMTLLAHTGVVTGNIYGGQTMNISSAGFRNVARSHSPKWILENVIKDHPITLKDGKTKVKDKETLYKWVAEQGAIDNFIKNEFEINDSFKKIKGVTKQNLINFKKEVISLLKKNPNTPDTTLVEVFKKYGIPEAMLKAGGSFMQGSERYLRTTSFLSHALQAREAFGKFGADIPLNDPFIIDMGLKGIENTQFLYHSAFRPAFMRTSLGKVLTRFKLFAFQSVRTRKEYYKMAKEMGFENDAEQMRKFKSLMTADLFTLAMGSIFAYSLFDTALPPPWDWLKETSEWMFGSKRDKERAFFGTYPYPLAPLQIITPPVARIPMSIFSTTLNGDWDRFMDYNVHTMYPFGRLVRSLDKTIYDRDAGTDMIKESPAGTTAGRFMKQFFRLPVDKAIGKARRSALEDQRREYLEEIMEGS